MNNDISQGEDVKDVSPTVETDTTDTSSSEKKTDQGTEESTSTVDTKVNDKHVPYERFAEVNAKANEWETKYRELEGKFNQPKVESNPQKEQIKEALKPILKELGFVSHEDLAQQEEDKQVQSEIASLAKQYDGSDGRPKFAKDEVIKYAIDNKIGSVEAAYKLLHEKDLINWQIARAIEKSKGIKTESSDGSGSSEVGTTNDDLKEAIAGGNKSALHTFLKRVTQPTK